MISKTGMVVLLSSSSFLLCCLLVPLCLAVDSPFNQVICVGQPPVSSSNHNCTSFEPSLSSAVQEVSDSSMIWLFNKQETIESIIKFEHLSSITLSGRGANGGTEIICNQHDVGYGLQFLNISDFTLRWVTIKSCGALYNISSQATVMYYFSSAVYFENCTNVEISDTVVLDSIGTGIMLFDCNGHVNIHHSIFTNNSATTTINWQSSELFLGGGGVYFELTECSPLWQDCDPNSNMYNKHSLIHIHSCVFTNNSVIADPDNIQFTNFRGGGMIFWLRGIAYNNTVVIEDNKFISNRGLYGGGLFVQCKGSPKYNRILVRNVTSVYNVAVLGGGGIDLGFYSTAPHLNSFNSISVISCTIMSNRAYFGGGNAFFSTLASQTNPHNTIEFNDTVWTLNEATYGSAIYLEPVINEIPANSFFPIPRFSNCNFTRNFITYNISGNSSRGVSISSVGAGAMNSKAISITLNGLIVFDGNNGTAVYFIDSNFIVLENTSIYFLNNSGTYGGAMSINGFASIYVNTNATFRFLDNTASVKGGAIYFYSIDIKSSLLTGSSCFVERTRTRKKFLTYFYFENNTDSFGKTLFISSLLPCNKLCQGTHVYLTYIPPDRLLTDECIGNFTFADYNGIVKDNVATQSAEFDHDDTRTDVVFPVVPGKDFVIPFETRDELGHISQEPLFAILRTNSSLSLQNIYTANKRFLIKGLSNDKGHLDIGTLNFRNLTVGINIKLSECPPGFINRNKTCLCSADYNNSDYYDGIIRCDNKEFQASISSGLWVGYDRGMEPTEDSLYTAACPPGYCDNNGFLSMRLPSVPSISILDSLVCGSKNRTGILCGQCIENNSVYFHSPDYKCGSNSQCSYGAIYYLLSSILPLTLLFTFVILFGINFSSGVWNGFVFYAQIVGYFTNGVVFSSHPERVLHIASVLLYGPFSLVFFSDNSLSYCLFKNANFFAIMGMECLSLMFAFILVVILVFVMKSNYFYKLQFLCCKRPIFKTTSLTKALTTFLILCYSQTTQICFKILHVGFLEGKGGSIVFPSRVFQMGDQVYFTGLHIPFALGALFGIVTIVTIIPLCLMLYPIFYKVLPQSLQEINLVKFFLAKVEILKPVFDAFQGCYKDKYRFFAGLYFLYRAVFVGIFALVNIHLASLSITQVILMVLLALHLWVQPYKSSLHNTIDGGLLLLLGIINTLTLTRYFESVSQSQGATLIFTGYLQLFFVYLPAVVVLVTLVARTVRKCYRKYTLQRDVKGGSHLNESVEQTIVTASISYVNMDRIEEESYLREEFEVLEVN